MSNPNEIDDILNELKNKKNSSNDENINFSFENEENNSKNSSSAVNKGEDEIKIELPKDNDDIINKTTGVINSENNFDSILSVNSNESVISADYDEYEEIDGDDNIINPKRKKIIIIAVAVFLIIAVAAVITFAAVKNKDKDSPATTTTAAPTTTTAAPVVVKNPLTGSSGYNTAAVGKRPVGFVVENSYAARPQWGIDDSKYSPDIIVEGEVEGGESRMLWLYADYTALPSQIGPMRSARPPYIRFSQLFDAVFIHWGQSSTSGNYYGADSVFRDEDVDHINQMTYSDKIGLFGRDKSRNVSSEHTGVLYGEKVAQAIEDADFRTDADDSAYTKFSFSEKEQTVGGTPCNTIGVTFSNRSKTRDWTYNSEDKLYHSSDYETDVERKNILVLYDTTEYVDKANYGGSGRTETYCEYKLSGGTGKLASMGTVTDITWSVENGVIVLKSTDGSDVKLNPGKTWIGYASSNNGGSAAIA